LSIFPTTVIKDLLIYRIFRKYFHKLRNLHLNILIKVLFNTYHKTLVSPGKSTYDLEHQEVRINESPNIYNIEFENQNEFLRAVLGHKMKGRAVAKPFLINRRLVLWLCIVPNDGLECEFNKDSQVIGQKYEKYFVSMCLFISLSAVLNVLLYGDNFPKSF